MLSAIKRLDCMTSKNFKKHFQHLLEHQKQTSCTKKQSQLTTTVVTCKYSFNYMNFLKQFLHCVQKTSHFVIFHIFAKY